MVWSFAGLPDVEIDPIGLERPLRLMSAAKKVPSGQVAGARCQQSVEERAL